MLRESGLSDREEGARHAPLSSSIVSVPGLLTQPTSPDQRTSRRHAIKSIPAANGTTLVTRIATTDDPLVLWALHLHLDKRDVPPCIRWPANLQTPQAEFITFLADMLWLSKRLPANHRAKFRGWRDLLAQEPASPAWHEHALRQFLFIAKRGSLAHWCATGLSLSDDQRTDLMMMPTAPMRAARTGLRPAALADLERILTDWAYEHPDRSGTCSPREVARRRLLVWRLWVLSDRSPVLTAKRWSLLTGEWLTRQRIGTLIAKVSEHAGSPRRRPVC